MTDLDSSTAAEILLVEDNPGDVRLTQEAFKGGLLQVRLSVAVDGADALAFLRREKRYAEARRPDLILLDLNLPRMNGRELLAVIKADPSFKRIPVVVLTSSILEEDVARAYDLHANCYVTKPEDLDRFLQVIRSVEEFWLTLVRLPKS